MAEKTLTVQQRNALFAQATRENWQGLAKKSVKSGATSVEFQIPKARLLSKILVDVDIEYKLKHASSTPLTTDKFFPYLPIRRVSLDLNNGWSPFVIGGKELAILNAIRMNSTIVYPQSSNDVGYCYCPDKLKSSSAGTVNKMRCTLELPLTLNDRDPVGIILAQNNETNIELKIDFASEADFIGNASGYTVTDVNITVQPSCQSFSIPAIQEAFPDISVIKLVTSRVQSFVGNGQNVVDLATGTIYRKLAFMVEDMDGVPFADEDFTSNIELVFNTADVNYSIPAKTLRHWNESQFNIAQPKGVYVFDFSFNGISNYGGTRDYIDTSKLTMFQLRFNSNKSGRIRIINENLARLV